MNVNICCTVDLSYNLKINRYIFKQKYLDLHQVINDKNNTLLTNLLLLLGKKLLKCSKRLEGHFKKGSMAKKCPQVMGWALLV
jgi:hypothetical protein